MSKIENKMFKGAIQHKITCNCNATTNMQNNETKSMAHLTRARNALRKSFTPEATRRSSRQRQRKRSYTEKSTANASSSFSPLTKPAMYIPPHKRPHTPFIFCASSLKKHDTGAKKAAQKTLDGNIVRKSFGFLGYLVVNKTPLPDATMQSETHLCSGFCEKLRILLVRNRAGHWDFPKGGAESVDRNDPMATAIREFKEETGMRTQCIKRIYAQKRFVYAYPRNQNKRHGSQNNGNVKYNVTTLYLCELKPKTILELDGKCDEREIVATEFVTLRDFASRFFWKEDFAVSQEIIETMHEECECRCILMDAKDTEDEKQKAREDLVSRI